MSKTSASEDVEASPSLQKNPINPSNANQNSQSQSASRNGNSPLIKQLNFATSPINAANKPKKNPLVPSLAIQAYRSPSPPSSLNNSNNNSTKNLNQSKNRHHIQVSDISPASHKNPLKDLSILIPRQRQQQQQEQEQETHQTDLSPTRAKIPTPLVPRLNIASMSRSCQSLNLSRAPIPPMNVGLGSHKTVSGFNLDLPEEYSAKNMNRPVLICLPWTTIPTSAGVGRVNRNYNINNNLRSENSYTSKSQKAQESSINTNDNPTTNVDFDDSAVNDLINSAFYSNRIFSTPDVLPNTVIIEEDEIITNANSCNSSRSTNTEPSSNSPRSFHSSAHNSLKLPRSHLSSYKSINSSSNSPASDRPKKILPRTASLTPNSPKPFNFLSTTSGMTPQPVSEVSTDSIPSLQAIDIAYQRVQHFPVLIEQTNSESTHLISHIESIIAEIELFRDERERLRVQNELIRSNICHVKNEIKIFNESQAKMKQVIEVLKSKNALQDDK